MGALMRTVLSNDQLLSWGWRIPFLTGSLNGLVAVYLWMYGHEHHPNEGEYDQSDGGSDQADGQKESGLPRYPIKEGKL